jgi:hypothetical protein
LKDIAGIGRGVWNEWKALHAIRRKCIIDRTVLRNPFLSLLLLFPPLHHYLLLLR